MVTKHFFSWQSGGLVRDSSFSMWLCLHSGLSITSKRNFSLEAYKSSGTDPGPVVAFPVASLHIHMWHLERICQKQTGIFNSILLSFPEIKNQTSNKQTLVEYGSQKKTPCLCFVIGWASPESGKLFKHLVQMDAFLKLTNWWMSQASGSIPGLGQTVLKLLVSLTVSRACD